MASGTPVGNMIIKVDLDAVGVEKSMTGLQRQLKSSNKAMGAQLSAFGRGEKSAKKYGVLIEGLSNRHRIQARMVEEARKKYADMSSTYGENSVKAQQAAQNLNEQIARYQETGRELDSVTAEFQEFQRVQEIQNKGWYKAADSLDKYGGKLKSAGKSMDQAGQTMTRKVTLPLAAVGGIATKVGSDFEAGMSKVGAVSGASAKDMDKLEKKAREMGATTIFSAKEASDAFYYMSLAGWDAQQSMDGIAGVMDLAAASGEDLALVSDIVTDGLTAFGLEAKDAGRMADVLASASANANTDVNGLGNAFKYAAPVAGALGYSIEDTSKAIGLMSNAGIKGEKAGTALRTMMTNLASPTKNMKKQMDKLGISLTDSNGEMKSLDTIMLDLRKSFKHLDKDQQAAAASTIFGKEAMSGALAIVNASESDYKKLSKAIAESEGSAKKMADVMQDNLQGSLKELQSMAEDLFITMYKNLKPSIESVVDSAKDLTQWFANLSPETQKNIVQFGLLAAAAGPVLSVTGKLTFGVGALMQGVGGLTKAIGLSKGVGLLGSMSMLGPGAVAGVAIAGAVGLGVAIYKLNKRTEKSKEINLDVVKSLDDKSEKLEESANTFDKLSKKAKISNEQLAELNDLNIRISQSSNPGEINELQKQYEALAKKSGLSKDELNRLFTANEDIIKQTPELKTSVSEQGNAFAENTEAVREQIIALQELSLIELDNQRKIALEEEKKIRQDIKKTDEEIAFIHSEIENYRKEEQLSAEEIAERLVNINELYHDAGVSAEDKVELQKEEVRLLSIQDGKHNEILKRYQSELEKKHQSKEKSEEELAAIKEIESEMANILLKQVGINEEGEKGLSQLDKRISKNVDELTKLEEKKNKNGELSEKEQERYEKLSATVEKQLEARDYLHDELGIYSDINSLAQAKIDKLDEEQQKKIESLAKSTDIKVEEGNIVKQLQNKNNQHMKEREQLEKNRQKQGANKKEIDKQIDAIDVKLKKNDDALVKILKELGVWDQVKDSINLQSKKIDEKNKKTDEGTGKQKKQGDQIDKNNKKTDEGIKKEKERTKEAGKDVDKNVKVKDNGTTDKINKKAAEPKNKDVNVKAKGIPDLNKKATEPKNKNVTLKAVGTAALNRVASSPVTKVVNFVGKGMKKLKFWAKGTPPQGHSGGDAVMGERGRELVKLPSGETFLTPQQATFYPNLPKGTHVIPNHKTERLLRGTPHYADGTSGWENALQQSELAKLLALNETNDSTVVVSRNRQKSESNREEVSLLRRQVELLTELVLSSRNIERKPVLTEGDIQRSYDKMDARESSKHSVFTGKPRRD